MQEERCYASMRWRFTKIIGYDEKTSFCNSVDISL
jgi:hypothetical protein